MRKGCLLAAIAFVIVVGLVLYFATRCLIIERGISLKSYVSGDFTYDVWSHGNWVASSGNVSTYEPPYTLILAIQPKDGSVKSIEILAASVVDKLGNKTSVLDKIKQRIEVVESHSGDVIKSPYAAFSVDAVLDSNDPITLEIEFRTNPSNNSKTVRQSLEIKGFENKRRSFLFWETMMSA